MKAIIDQGRLTSVLDTVFNPFANEQPIRSFQIMSKNANYSNLAYTLNVYATRITASSASIKNELIATIDDGKEKFIKDTEEFLVNLKAELDELVITGVADKFIVRTENYDPHCFITQDFDKFIELFIKSMDYFVVE